MNMHPGEKSDEVIVPEKRPLSILCLEDKIVQQAVVFVLEAVFEEDFLGFSYGFRPGFALSSFPDWPGTASRLRAA